LGANQGRFVQNDELYLKKNKIKGVTTQPFFPSSQNILIPGILHALYLSPFVTLPKKKFKILATILNPYLSKLILDNQGGFLENKKIVYNIVLVQEAFLSIHKNKYRGMVIKLDMENYFDWFKRSFLYSILRAFGFFKIFINLVKECIGSLWISPMINGNPTQFIKTNRGLGQGFPSPPIYIYLDGRFPQQEIGD
jgi:hypothetical protein